MNEKLIRDLFEKLEQYGIKGWEILVRGMVVTSWVEVICGLLVIIPIVLTSKRFYTLSKEDDDYTPGVYIPLVFLIIPIILIPTGVAGVITPEYFVLKSFMK